VTRQFALGEVLCIALAPSTRLVARGGNATDLELVQGDAYFTVSHDPSRPLSIRAGEYAVSDIGTTFGINLSPQAVAVSVAEGRVSVTPGRGDVTKLGPGQQLIADRSDGTAQLGTVSAKDVGSWRRGRLVYNNAPLAVVAADISRYSGKTVTVDPALSDRQFSGILPIGDGSGLLANLAELMAISYQEKGDSARLGPAADR
jgi:transmembrane sensor